MPVEKSAGAIIYRLENGALYYLLLHYAPSEPGKKGHWEFPKGHVEKGETEEETIKREVKEETGIGKIEIVLGFKQYIKYFFRKVYGLKGQARKNAPWVMKLVVFFLAKTEEKKIVLSDEHVGFVWLPFEQAVKKLTFKNAKELLKKADEFIKEKRNFT